MREHALSLFSLLAALGLSFSVAATELPPKEQVQSDLSTREISIQSNFTGIEIVLFGAIDFTRVPSPEEGQYDVIMVVRGPQEPMVIRRKERMAGLWVNGASKTFPLVPSFYAVLSSRPLRAIATADVLEGMGIGFAALDFDPEGTKAAEDPAFRSNLIALREQRGLFQEKDNAISFVGRSLFRGTVDLPVSVPIGRYTTQVYLFRDGKLLSQDNSTLQVHKVGFERLVYLLAFRYPFIYGLLAVFIAVLGGLIAWGILGRRE